MSKSLKIILHPTTLPSESPKVRKLKNMYYSGFSDIQTFGHSREQSPLVHSWFSFFTFSYRGVYFQWHVFLLVSLSSLVMSQLVKKHPNKIQWVGLISSAGPLNFYIKISIFTENMSLGPLGHAATIQVDNNFICGYAALTLKLQNRQFRHSIVFVSDIQTFVFVSDIQRGEYQSLDSTLLQGDPVLKSTMFFGIFFIKILFYGRSVLPKITSLKASNENIAGNGSFYQLVWFISGLVDLKNQLLLISFFFDVSYCYS